MTDQEIIRDTAMKAFEASMPPIYRKAKAEDFSDSLQPLIRQLFEGRNAIILGDNGVGKTHLAWVVIKELNRQEKRFRFVKAQVLLFDIKRQDDPYAYIEKQFSRCDCLIVDEIDKIFDSKADFIYLNYLVDFMTEWQKQIIFIGNGDRQTFLASLGQSIYSRLRADKGLELFLTGEDRRLD